MDFRSHDLDIKSAQCCWDFVVSRPFWQTELRNTYTHAHTLTHTLLYRKHDFTAIPQLSAAPQSRLQPFSFPYSKLPSPMVRRPASIQAPDPQYTCQLLDCPVCVTIQPHACLLPRRLHGPLPWPHLKGTETKKEKRLEKNRKGMYHFSVAAVTNHHKLGGLGIYSLMALEA